MSERDAYVLEILIGQIPKRTKVNIVFGKALGVLGHSQLLKPVRNFLHSGANDLVVACSSLQPR
jgi:hypothetical protein